MGIKARDDALNGQPPTDVNDAKTKLTTYIDGVMTLLHDAVKSLQASGIPKVKGGAAIAAYLPKQLTKIRSTFADDGRKLKALSTTDPTAIQGLRDIAASVTTHVRNIGKAVTTLFAQKFPGPGTLSPALAHDPACA